MQNHFKEFKTMISNKITSLTLIQHLNKFILYRETLNLKASIIWNAQQVLLININTISNKNKYSFLWKFSQGPEPNEKVKKIEKYT